MSIQTKITDFGAMKTLTSAQKLRAAVRSRVAAETASTPTKKTATKKKNTSTSSKKAKKDEGVRKGVGRMDEGVAKPSSGTPVTECASPPPSTQRASPLQPAVDMDKGEPPAVDMDKGEPCSADEMEDNDKPTAGSASASTDMEAE